MEITLNNKKEIIKDKNNISVKDLLAYKNFTFKMLIVRINNIIIEKEDFDKTIIKDGDDVNILHLISGG